MLSLAMRLEIGMITFLIFTCQLCSMEEERSFLESFLPIYRIFKKASSDTFRANEEHPRSRALLRRNNKRLVVPPSMQFPCNLDAAIRSPEVPKTAHKVRPGDVDIIGALGDSLTAGFGASANNLLEILSENRGKSFSIGGQGTWRTMLTLPNILKMFNPKLFGYSLRTSISLENESQFNVAEGGAISSNMPYMAKVLVQRIKSDPRVNIDKQWKMITLMVGDNDFCSEMCYYKNPEILLTKHKEDLLSVLRILKTNLPKTIVNIIPPPHVGLLTLMTDKSLQCKIAQAASCSCLGQQYADKRNLYFDIMTKWQKLDLEVSNYPEFDLDDFTVIPHFFTSNYTLPRRPDGGIDYSYFSEDCFHFSEKGQARCERTKRVIQIEL